MPQTPENALATLGTLSQGLAIANFGCGPMAPGGLINIDGSLTVLAARLPLPARAFGAKSALIKAFRQRHVRYGTARRIPLAPASLDGFYASHVLEHLARSECAKLLRRVRAWLKPQGVLRIVLPDLHLLASQFVAGQFNADEFVRRSHLAVDGMNWRNIFLGRSYHRWMYDPDSALALLRATGFNRAHRCQCGESALPALAQLDIETGRASDSFYLESPL